MVYLAYTPPHYGLYITYHAGRDYNHYDNWSSIDYIGNYKFSEIFTLIIYIGILSSLDIGLSNWSLVFITVSL